MYLINIYICVKCFIDVNNLCRLLNKMKKYVIYILVNKYV